MQNNEWLTKDRSETAINRLPSKTLENGVVVENLALGINNYKSAIPKDVCDSIIDTLESNLNGLTKYSWQAATVTESNDPLLDARNCVDFKIGQKNLGPIAEDNSKLYDMHESAFKYIYPVSQDYGRYWGVGIGYYEAMNFVKYEGKNTHFNIHADHGPAYVATISIVAYLNDNYDGGEIYFPRFNLTVKPGPGDVLVFPSTYIYEHASLPMISGTKYSVVIMTDYNNRGNLRYHAYREEDSALTY